MWWAHLNPELLLEGGRGVFSCILGANLLLSAPWVWEPNDGSAMDHIIFMFFPSTNFREKKFADRDFALMQSLKILQTPYK